MSQTSDRSKTDQLLTAGEFFLDLIFFDLSRLPQLGEELKTENFALSPGGGAAITAAAAARLGRPVSLATVWGDSPLDAAARELLEELGVDWQGAQIRQGSISGLTVAVSTRSDRYFLTYPGANRFLEHYLLSEASFERLSQAGHVHLALAPSSWQPYLQLVNRLRKVKVTTSWDMGWDPQAAASDGFRSLCSQLDVLFLNDMEARRYTGSESVEEAIHRLSSDQNTVVVKCGSQGAMGFQDSQIVQASGIEVEAVDTTGAGDSFNGGFLHAWMRGDELSDCLRAGNVCGGLSTRAPGGVASLPSLAEFEEWAEP